MKIVLLGDRALRIELPGAGVAVRDALRALPGVQDVVIGETQVAVHLLPGAPAPAIAAALAAVGPAPPQREHAIRVRYDGPDLARVAERAGLTIPEVIELHAAPLYTVRAVGFLPGFAYLGDVDARIATPRLATPRPRVPALSVGLAGARTAVYPFASPGGWNLLGTALDLVPFDPATGARLAPGDRVRFVRG